MKLGELLREARVERNISLNDVEKATKIRAAYIEAIEQENFQLLPGRIYVIGFIKSYAKFLNLNDTEIIELYKSQYPEKTEVANSDNNSVEEISIPNGPSKKLYYIIAAAALAILVFLGVFYQRESNPPVQPPAVVDEQNQQEEPPRETEQEPPIVEPIPEPVLPEQVTVTVELVHGSCWLQVNVDGKEVFAATAANGTTHTFTGNEEVRVRFGNAGAARVIHNGNDIGIIGDRGQVITRTFTLDNN